MQGITRARGFKRRGRVDGLAAVALATLVFLAALPAPAIAQTSNNYTGLTVVHTGIVSLTRGQTLLVTAPSYMRFQDGSVRFVKHSIRVTDRESNLVYSGESGALEHELGHTFTLRHYDLPAGESRTDRFQVWIELNSYSFSQAQGAEDPDSVVFPPTFELVDSEGGKTILMGLLLPAIQKVDVNR